ncbi:hypothetical protein MAR_038163, partial [Mya arenaria]
VWSCWYGRRNRIAGTVTCAEKQNCSRCGVAGTGGETELQNSRIVAGVELLVREEKQNCWYGSRYRGYGSRCASRYRAAGAEAGTGEQVQGSSKGEQIQEVGAGKVAGTVAGTVADTGGSRYGSRYGGRYRLGAGTQAGTVADKGGRAGTEAVTVAGSCVGQVRKQAGVDF